MTPLRKALVQEAGGLKAFLFNWGFKRKLHFIEQGYPQHSVSTCAGCSRQVAGALSAHATPFCRWAPYTCWDKVITAYNPSRQFSHFSLECRPPFDT